MEFVVLSNGVKVPSIGFGTYKFNEEEAYRYVKEAIKNGFRHIDSAYAYFNEKGTGRAIKECIDEGIVTRDELFVTTKIRSDSDLGFHRSQVAFAESLQNLQLDYVDLLLIHTPAEENRDWKRLSVDIWCALEKLYSEGKAKSIGVSNYGIDCLTYLLSVANIIPHVNQIELNYGCQQKELVNFCNGKGILLSAWSALNQGYLSNVDPLNTLALKYSKSQAQICLRWALQKGFVPLCRTSKIDRMRENINVFDFVLSEGDIEIIDRLDCTQNRYKELLYSRTSQKRSTKTYIFKLFGILPFLKLKLSEWKWRWYLFGIQVLTVKRK